MKKLVSTITGEDVTLTPGLLMIAQNGKVRGNKFVVGEVIQPSDEEPNGLLKSRKSEGGWQAFYPSVFNLEFVEGEDNEKG